MLSNDKSQIFIIADEELLQISGGSSSILDEQGLEIKEGRFITSTFAGYTSGNTPKFSVGDPVKIKWQISSNLEVLCDAEVTGVSANKDGGLLFQKYTYSVKILTCPNSDMLGMIESNVHENCLFL